MSSHDAASPASTNPVASSGSSSSTLHENPESGTSGSKRSQSSSSTSRARLAGGLARHTIGIILLLTTVFLWTASSFLASTIFADNTYSKPYFVTYVNSSFFAFLLAPVLVKRAVFPDGNWRAVFQREQEGIEYAPLVEGGRVTSFKRDSGDEAITDDGHINERPDTDEINDETRSLGSMSTMDFRETAWLSLEFSILWFVANYFAAACLEYTTVASTTILTSTSSIWTLLIGAGMGVEKFTLKKVMGVIASFAGVILTSSVDISGGNDENRGSFPYKSPQQVAIGDVLALLSAVLYADFALPRRRRIYTTVMKKKIGDESRVNMPLFFGFVGLFNTLMLLPGFPILHFTGIEPFALPSTRRIWTIILVNSAASLVSDLCWAYSMLLTSPLVVTVGLSLTIPLSLIGQMILNSQSSSGMYWIGAVVVFLSFLFVNHESKQQE
ncbi:MAG: hypothetical protein Q9181_000182 [Wetmoreana brouardii]